MATSDNVPTKTFAKQISTVEYNNQKEDYTQKALRELNEQMKTFKRPSYKINTNNTNNTNKKNTRSIINDGNDGNDILDDEEIKSSFDHKYNNVFNDNAFIDNLDNEENSDNEGNSDSEGKSDKDVNLIIKHVIDNKKKRNSNSKSGVKTTNTNTNTNSLNENIVNAIYAQHEIDINNISKLNKTIIEIKQKIKDSEREYDDMDCKMHYLKLDLGNSQLENETLKKEIEILKKENVEITEKIIILCDREKSDRFYFNILKWVCLFLLIFNLYYAEVKYFLFVAGVIAMFI